jgi:hypothetical protein
MRNRFRSDARGNQPARRKTPQIRPKEVPNQALYQAEPQPEMDLSTERASRRGSYFAHFAEEGKELETQFERSPRNDGFPGVIVGAAAAQAVIPWCSCVIVSCQ